MPWTDDELVTVDDGDITTKEHYREDDNGPSRPPQLRNQDAGNAPEPPRGEHPWIHVQRHASRPAQSRPGRQGQTHARAAGTLYPSSSTTLGNLPRTVNHYAGTRGMETSNGGSRFNVLENVEAQFEDVTHTGLQSHPFFFSSSGRRVEQNSVVQSEPSENQSGPIPTEEATTVAIAPAQGPADGPPGQTHMGQGTGSGPHPLATALVNLQPSATDKHLVLEL
ncbi:hypothetical protein K2173_021636 [Erythroxylum novogranatense]|uniref:Uncharacterized protein n=1 Tax=Erythroxylum novogranatense TaxID=1862640 RepID=A0AAV8TIV4_9ROSI|nr:hypothetical protein K2173_021636 [Erythroxylum novogranatense]